MRDVDTVLVVVAHPAELDLAEVVASIAVGNIAVIADLIQRGFVDSVAAVGNHNFGPTSGRQSPFVEALPVLLNSTVEASLVVAIIALLVVFRLKDTVPAVRRVLAFL